MLPKEDRDRRIEALSRLALGTQAFAPPKTAEERHALEHYLLMYLEDTARFATAVMVEACERWRKRERWFPKSAELIQECKDVGRQRAEQVQQTRRLRAHIPDPVTDEQIEAFKARIRELVRKKVIR